MEFKEDVFRAVARIPKGRVATYAQVAQLAGYTASAARAVGNAIHTNTDPVAVPCHRVVCADGSLGRGYALGGPAAQKARLEAEGVVFLPSPFPSVSYPSAPEDLPASLPSVSEGLPASHPSASEDLPASLLSASEDLPASLPSASEDLPASHPSAPAGAQVLPLASDNCSLPPLCQAPEGLPASLPSAPEDLPISLPSASEGAQVLPLASDSCSFSPLCQASEGLPASLPSAPEGLPISLLSASEGAQVLPLASDGCSFSPLCQAPEDLPASHPSAPAGAQVLPLASDSCSLPPLCQAPEGLPASLPSVSEGLPASLPSAPEGAPARRTVLPRVDLSRCGIVIEDHPLKPFLPPGGRILFLGSFPPPRCRWSMDFFYPNWNNDFWRIQGLIHFGDAHHFDVPGEKRFDRESIVSFCFKEGMAFYDTAQRVCRLKANASDEFLEVLQNADVSSMLAQMPDCKIIVTTGGKASEELADILGVDSFPQMGASLSVSLPVSSVSGGTGLSVSLSASRMSGGTGLSVSLPASRMSGGTGLSVSLPASRMSGGTGLSVSLPASRMPDGAGREIVWWRMPSSSHAFPMSLSAKADYYRLLFDCRD